MQLIAVKNIEYACIYSHIMHFEWGSEFCDPTEVDLDCKDVKLNDSAPTDPEIMMTL